MIRSRKYIPSNKAIEVHLDPNLSFGLTPKKGLMGLDDPSGQSEYGPVKPLAPMEDMMQKNLLTQDIDLEGTNMRQRAPPLLDKPPTVEDFAEMRRVQIRRFGPKFRISSMKLPEKDIQMLFNARLNVPERDANGNVVYDENGKMKMQKRTIKALLDTSKSRYEMLNAINNTDQKLGAIALPLLCELFRDDYDDFSNEVKTETCHTIEELDVTNRIDNADFVPYLIDPLYMYNKTTPMYPIKWRIHYILYKEGIAAPEIERTFNDGHSVMIGPNYLQFAPGVVDLQRIRIIMGTSYGMRVVAQEFDLHAIQNLLSNVANGEINNPAVQAAISPPDLQNKNFFVLAVYELLRFYMVRAGARMTYANLLPIIFRNILGRYTTLAADAVNKTADSAVAMTRINGYNLRLVVHRDVMAPRYPALMAERRSPTIPQARNLTARIAHHLRV